MKLITKHCLILLIAFIPLFSFSQKTEKARISQIEKKITVAVDKGDYEKAADLKKEKEKLEEIIVALEEGDYEKAASLKKGLENGASGSSVASTKNRLSEVEDEISKAVENGNYEKAAELKKEKELLEELIIAQENGDSEKVDELQAKLSDGGSASGASNKEVSPEFVNQVYMWDKSSNELKRLEKQKGTLETSTSAAPFYAKSTSFYKVDGEYSSVRKDNDHSFVIKVIGGQDPRDIVELVIFKPGKDGKDRYMPYYESSGYAYGGSSGEVKDIKVPISIKKVKDGVYEIIPDETLKDGEYGFKVIDKFYCFGVGPKGAKSEDQDNASPMEEQPRESGSDGYNLATKGYFIDFMLGVGSTSDLFGMAFVPGIKMGNKLFYARNNSAFKPGLALVFARIQVGLSGDGYYVSASPGGMGFASIIEFSENAGLEFNVDAMLNVLVGSISDTDATTGILISPNTKFRYKALAIGLDFAFTYNTDITGNDPSRTSAFFGVSVGAKF